MRKLILFFILILAISCTDNKYKVVYSPSFKDDPVRLKVAHNDSMMHPERYDTTTMEERDKIMDSLTALGCYILVRGSDRNYDTIIDHTHYIYTTEE